MSDDVTSKIKAAIDEGRRLTDERNRQFAMDLLEAGFSIIPCDWLQDNQIIVSGNVYHALKEAGGKG